MFRYFFLGSRAGFEQLRVFAFAAGKSQGRSEETRAAERVSGSNGAVGKSFATIPGVWVAYGEEFKKCVVTVAAGSQRAGKESLRGEGSRDHEWEDSRPRRYTHIGYATKIDFDRYKVQFRWRFFR